MHNFLKKIYLNDKLCLKRRRSLIEKLIKKHEKGNLLNITNREVKDLRLPKFYLYFFQVNYDSQSMACGIS